LSLQAGDGGDTAAADDALRRAREAAPHAPRPLIIAARRASQAGDATAAFDHYTELLQHAPALFPLIASEYATAAIQAGQAEAARATVIRRMKEQPSVDLLQAMRLLDGAAPAQTGVPDAGERAQALLHAQPTLSAALAVLDVPLDVHDESALRDVREAVARAARAQQRYRCAACGFEAPQHFWQCPGCLSWDTFPAQRIEEL
jgi:lipopolysaccharide biosynthesis regulator YciM